MLRFAAGSQAHEVHRERTALEFAEHTLWALEKGSDRFKGIPDPPAYARPALDDMPVAQPPKCQQEPAPAAVRPPVAPLKPEVRKALTRVARLRSSRSLAPCMTTGWTPKVLGMAFPITVVCRSGRSVQCYVSLHTYVQHKLRYCACHSSKHTSAPCDVLSLACDEHAPCL